MPRIWQEGMGGQGVLQQGCRAADARGTCTRVQERGAAGTHSMTVWAGGRGKVSGANQQLAVETGAVCKRKVSPLCVARARACAPSPSLSSSSPPSSPYCPIACFVCAQASSSCTMFAGSVQSSVERDFVIAAAKEGARVDGRKMNDFRKVNNTVEGARRPGCSASAVTVAELCVARHSVCQCALCSRAAQGCVCRVRER